MTDHKLPDPLVPAEVDLRDFAFMPLDVRRFRDCRLVATKPPEEALAAILLWSASWHQQPASSLPDDDVELSQLAGYGRAVREYKRIKEGSLYGFMQCSDGRWYHPVVAEKAAEGWNAKLLQEHKRACDRQRKANKERAERKEEALPMPPHPPLLIVTYTDGIPTWMYSDSVGTDETVGGNSSGNGGSVLRKSRLKGQGQCKGQGQGLGTTAPDVAADPIFGPYLAMMQAKGMHPGAARNFLALMRVGYGDDLVLAVLAEAQRQDVTKPLPWIKKALETRHRNNGQRPNKQEALEERNRRALQDWQPPEVRDATQ